MADIKTIGYDDEVTLTANGFSLQGYTFAGWNTKANGSGTSYADKETVSELSATNGAIVTLYAQWTARPDTAYTVEHYVMNTSGSYPTTATKTDNKTGTTDASLTLSGLKDSTLEVAGGTNKSFN